jgi:hypothetical protein
MLHNLLGAPTLEWEIGRNLEFFQTGGLNFLDERVESFCENGVHKNARTTGVPAGLFQLPEIL